MTRPTGQPFRALVTRPVEQARALMAAIESGGGQGVLFPVMEIEPRGQDAIASDLASQQPADLVIFVSANAARYGVVAAGPRNAAIGAATAAALAKAGASVDIVPASGFTSEALLGEPALRDVEGRRVRIVRGNGGRELLGETLSGRGADVDYLGVYRRRRHRATPDELAALELTWHVHGMDYVIVMSEASLEFLLELLPARCRRALSASVLVSPSARVLKTAQVSVPGARTLLADSPAAGDLVAAMAADRQAHTDESDE